MNKPLNTKLLNHTDIYDLNELLLNDINIINALDIITNKYNINIINNIKNKLNNGYLIEDIISNYTNTKFKLYFNSFSNILSFINSFNLATSLSIKDKLIKDNIINNIKYPLFLLFTTIISIILFYLFAFNNLISFSKSFNQDILLIYNIRFISLLMVYIILFIIIIIFIIYLYIKYNNKQVLLYVLLCNYLPISIFKEYISYQFILFYKQCLLVNLKPYETLNILRNIKNKPIISYLAYIIYENLNNGNDLNESINNKYIDYKLYRFINLSIYTNNILELLNIYLNNTEQRINKFYHNITKYIQIFSYIMIGLLIILVYQIILMPLEIIGGY